MKRIIVSAMILITLLTTIGGCWPWWYGPGGGENHRGPRGPQGGGPGGGGHGDGGPGGGH